MFKLKFQKKSFRAEAEPGTCVIDSACNRTMMGELCMPELEASLQSQGMRVVYEEMNESFVFGNSGEETIRRIAVIPIAIQGICGELRVCLVPNARTPLLVSRGDLQALRARFDFGENTFR